MQVLSVCHDMSVFIVFVYSVFCLSVVEYISKRGVNNVEFACSFQLFVERLHNSISLDWRIVKNGVKKMSSLTETKC